MDAPDKLYASQLIYKTWQYQTPDPDDDTQVEYIRKEALVEWIQTELKSCEGAAAMTRAYHKLIDKINEL